MYSLQLTFLYCMLNLISGNQTLGFQSSSPTAVVKSITADSIKTNNVAPRAINTIFQSKDGGETWQDISEDLPLDEGPQNFFAGASELYIRFKDEMYRSKSNLQTPVWEKENVLDPEGTSIAFNRSGVMAYNYEGQIYLKMLGTWSPVYTNFKNQPVETIFETSDGTVFLGCRNGLYRSTDKGRSWKQVHNEGWVMELVESEGVLIATGQNGIMRSADNGERWEWVISKGGVGIAVERIDGGFAAICYDSKTTSRRIYISMDRGETWNAIDGGLRSTLSISSVKQFGKYLICGHPDGIFRSSDMGKTWKLVHSNPIDTFRISEGKVYKIYVSGNVLYAVLRNSGC